MKLFKAKLINSVGKSFIARLSMYLWNKSSIKMHIILGDDMDKDEHTHPWNFKSLLLVPYIEELSGEVHKHRIFSIVKRNYYQTHKVRLYRIFGIPIPAWTIGIYSEKKVLCSFCQSLGYCKTTGKPI